MTEKQHINRSDVMQNIAAFAEHLKKEIDIEKRHILNELLQHEQEKLRQLGLGDD